MDEQTQKYAKEVKNYILNNYRLCFRNPAKRLPYPFLVPGAAYAQDLWDWDSWLTGLALMEINDPDIEKYQKGCVLDFLANQDEEGRIQICVRSEPWDIFELKKGVYTNVHKPCLIQHALEISTHYHDIKWLENDYSKLKKYLSYYEKHQFHKESNLYYPIDDLGLGFDNDPTVFYRPKRSTGSIYLNSLMYGELISMSKVSSLLGYKKDSNIYLEKAKRLEKAIHEELFDIRDGFFYSADILLRKVDPNVWLQKGAPRNYHSLPMRIETWAGMLPLYYGIATKDEAKECVKKHYLNPNTLYSNYGIRSVSKAEKMYRCIKSGNPSCWTGPIWINANYFTYIGLKKYGYHKLADELAIKTINLLGKDYEKQGKFSEYYDPDSGIGLNNPGFQSWNFLVLNMINDLETTRKK